MISERLMQRRAAYLDDFQARRAFEHPVTDSRRLQDQIALAHHE
jgi:hypothetical protein